VEARAAEAVARRFLPSAPALRVAPHIAGHIHETWFVTSDAGCIVLQRLNDRVFPDCARMMDNVVRVVEHLRRAHPSGRGLEVVRADDGSVLVHDDDASPWRAFGRVARTRSHEVVASPHVAHEVGRGLGRFFTDVQTLPGSPLCEPIPGFKDFARRRRDFELAVEVDAYGRAGQCEDDIAALRRHHDLVDALEAARAAGKLPERVVHNDAKANNVLLDEDTETAVCVVDLDTVAPGAVAFDVGDLLRSATVTAPEDSVDLSELGVRDNLLEAALRGYLAEAGPVLSDDELGLFPLAGPLMAYENALRFLTDHLAGDTYFRIDRPRHNLDRARAQVRVLEALDHAADRVDQVVRRA
jgi:aminoglycoside phosphotransferase (APT) family kinase protein